MKLLQTCHFSSAWAGHDIGLSRATLRFHDQGLEKGFVHGCSAILVESTFYSCIILVILATGYALVYPGWLSKGLKEGGSDLDGLPIVAIPSCLIVSVILLSATALVCLSVPHVLRRISLRVRERVLVAGLMWILVVVFACNPLYLISLIGYNPQDFLDSNFAPVRSDGGTLMVASVVITSSHLSLPLRWSTLIPLEILAGVMSVGVVIVRVTVRSRDIEDNLCLCFLFLSNVIMAVIGKRQLEFANRLTFTTLLREKGQRCQAEFMLSQKNESTPDKQQVDERSQPESLQTTSSGAVFSKVLESGGQSLHEILRMGASEQWLLQEEEISLSRGMIGRGGFGLVAAGSFLGSPVAVKIAAKGSKQSKVDSSLANELRIMRKLRHPNIVLFHGACVNSDTGEFVLVLARVFGKRLDDFVLGGRGDGAPGSSLAADGTTFHVLVGMARALLYLHSRVPYIVHGDLKPMNFMVEVHNVGPCPKLLDFGLARLLTPHAKPLGGTIQWASPEAVSRSSNARTPHPSADMFSFGRLIYFVCSGIVPLHQYSREAIVRGATAMTAEPLEWPTELSAIAAHCVPIVEECTHLTPASRLSIKEVYARLLRFQDETTVGGQRVEDIPSAAPGSARRTFWQLAEQLRQEQRQVDKKGGKFARLGSHRGFAASPQGKPLPTLKEDGTGPCLSHPRLEETPMESIGYSLVCAMMSWNFECSVSSCCQYHSALELLRKSAKRLEKDPCMSDFQEEDVAQCPSCKLLICAEDINEMGFNCRFCGYMAQDAPQSSAVASSGNQMPAIEHNSEKSGPDAIST